MKHAQSLLIAVCIIPFAIALAPTNPGDLNNDGLVNIQDVFIVSSCLGQNAATCQSGRADPNNDNAVNVYDFIHVSKRWGTTYGSPQPPTVLLTEHFEDNQLSTRGWYDSPNGLLSTTEHVPGSAASMQYLFNAGSTTPTQGKTARHLITATDQVYLSYWIKYSSNWVGSGVPYHPHQFHFVNDLDSQWIGPSVTHTTLYVEEISGRPRLAQQDALNIDQARVNQNLIGVTENRATAGCNGDADSAAYDCYSASGSYVNSKGWLSTFKYFGDTPGQFYKNDWHFVEAYFKLNSVQNGIGVADGVAQYWFDGQQVFDVNDALFRTGQNPTMKLNQLIIGPYMAPTSGTGSPVTQSFWVDNLTVMTARPGSYTPPPQDTTSPSVSLTAPAAGTTVSGTSTTISASATDNVAVQNVQFTMDGSNYGSPDATSPYSISWDTTTATNGQHTLGAIARDAAGNTGSAATRTVTVSNAAPPSCGNGVIESGEQCDGSNLNGATCVSRGFTGGTLGCHATTCQYVTSACTNPPPPPGTRCANEPPGFTLLSDRPFDAKVEDGWTDRGDGAFSIVSDSTTSSGQPGPQSPPNVGQARFAGNLGGNGPIMTNLDIPSKPRELYFCFQNQYSSNFYGGDIAGINKMFHIWQHGATVVVLSAQGRAMGALSPQMRLQNVQVGPDIPSFNLNPTLNSTPFVRGQWQQVEVLLVGNTPGQQDGEIHWWVDGSKKGQNTTIGWVSSNGNPGWEKVSWNPTYGSTGDVVPAPQYQWIDNWYVSGK